MSYLFLGWRRSRSPVKKGVNEQDLHLFLPRNLLQLQPRVTQGTGVKDGITSLSIPEKPMLIRSPFLPHVFRQTRVSATFPPKANS